MTTEAAQRTPWAKIISFADNTKPHHNLRHDPSRAPSLDRRAAEVRKLKGMVVHWEGEEARREMALGEARESLSAARAEYALAESQYMDACRQAIG
jgi:hypothetical protein